MKLLSCQSVDGGTYLAALVDGRVIDLHEASNGEIPGDMLSFLQAGASAMQRAQSLILTRPERRTLDSVKLLAPITNPSKVIAIGLNYSDHVRESGIPMPEVAAMFCKYPSSIIGHGEDIRWPGVLTQQVDYEAELAIVIGKTARNVCEADAYEYIAGYTICNDVSARDLQFTPGDQWLRGKCLDTFCPLGPYLVTRDEIADPQQLSIKCLLNGETMQNSNTAQMIYQIPYLIEYLSKAFTLLPGDVIVTGTPHGVGAFRKPPVWMKDGDEVIVEIEGLGQLRNRCVEEN